MKFLLLIGVALVNLICCSGVETKVSVVLEGIQRSEKSPISPESWIPPYIELTGKAVQPFYFENISTGSSVGAVFPWDLEWIEEKWVLKVSPVGGWIARQLLSCQEVCDFSNLNYLFLKSKIAKKRPELPFFSTETLDSERFRRDLVAQRINSFSIRSFPTVEFASADVWGWLSTEMKEFDVKLDFNLIEWKPSDLGSGFVLCGGSHSLETIIFPLGLWSFYAEKESLQMKLYIPSNKFEEMEVLFWRD